MPSPHRTRLTTVTLLALLSAACQQGATIGTGCERASQCATPLVCGLGRCRQECVGDRDCPVSARCLLVGGVGACSLTEETNCPAQPCPTDTTCLSGVCTSSCATDADCPGGPCVDVSVGGTSVRGCADGRTNDGGFVGDGGHDAGSDAGLPQIVAVAAGRRTACLLTATGEVWCWGANQSGQLGDGVATHDGSCSDPAGTFDDHSISPVRVAISGALDVSVGDAHACVRVNGAGGGEEARCWGDNGAGQLGHVTPIPSSTTPLRVVDGAGATITGILELDAWGASTLARTADGLLGWGDGHAGQLGFDTTAAYIPVPMATSLPMPIVFSDIDVTRAGAGIDMDGQVRTWGIDDHGALGRGTSDGLIHEDFAVVPGVSGALAIDHGVMATCARTASEVLCWGYPWTALGRDGDHSACPEPNGALGSCAARPIVGLPAVPIVDVAMSGSSTCVVMMGGDVYCTSATSELVAQRILPEPMQTLVAGDEFFCGLSERRAVYCWGRGTCGQTGDSNHPTDGGAKEIAIR